MTRQIGIGEPYLDKVLKLIPAEIVAVFLAIQGFVGGQPVMLHGEDITREFLWVVFGLLLVLTALYLKLVHQVSKASQVVLGTLAFAVWVYSLGGPFEAVGWYQPQIAATVLAIYTLFIPLVVPEAP